MLPNYHGVAFNLAPEETFFNSQACTLSVSWNARNCYLAVFVQSDNPPYPVFRSSLSSLRYFFPYVPGDANGDGIVSVEDVVFLINYLYKEGISPNPFGSGDPNADCIVDVADIVYLLNYLFKIGPAPQNGCN